MENELRKEQARSEAPETEENETTESPWNEERKAQEEAVKKDAADIAKLMLENNGFGDKDSSNKIEQVLRDAMERKYSDDFPFDDDTWEKGMKRKEMLSIVSEVNRILKENGSTQSLDLKYAEHTSSQLSCPPFGTKDLRQHIYKAFPEATLTLKDASGNVQASLTANAKAQDRVWLGSGSCRVVPAGLPRLFID
jgi:hypothetical protein